MKWTRKDAAIRFEVEVPKDADIVGEKKKAEEKKADEKKTDDKKGEEKKVDDKKTEQTKTEEKKTDQTDKKLRTSSRRTTRRRRKSPSRRRRPRRSTSSTTSRAGKLTLLADYEPDPKKPGWAQVSPGRQDRDLRPRPQPLHDGRGELQAGAEGLRRPEGRRGAADHRRRGALQLRAAS